jgi:SAM-dependent methyltransferase
MVDKIPANFWENKSLKILDPCCGNGNFHAYLQTKTDLSNLYFNEINERRIINLVNYFGPNINLQKKDFLTFTETETYDLVVANPPYAKFNLDVRVSKNHNLSRDFIKKALSITKKDGYILFIVPNNWMSLSDRNILPQLLSQFQFIHIDIHGAKKWFPKVGSSFTWFLLQNTPNTNSFTISNNYHCKDIVMATLTKGIPFIPLYYNDLVKSIIEKTIFSNIPKYKIETTSYLHHYTKKEKINAIETDVFCHRLIHTTTQTAWSSIPHKFQKGYKVFLSLTNQYKAFVDDCGMTQSIAFVRCKSKKEADLLQHDLSNEVYVFLNNITRYGNFNNVRVLQCFPVWGSFELTHEEKIFIKKFNTTYYGKEKK